VAANQEEVRQHVNFFLKDPNADGEKRRKFILDECTYTDGSAGERTGKYLLSLLEKNDR
jgi:hypothetical protein